MQNVILSASLIFSFSALAVDYSLCEQYINNHMPNTKITMKDGKLECDPAKVQACKSGGKNNQLIQASHIEYKDGSKDKTLETDTLIQYKKDGSFIIQYQGDLEDTEPDADV